MVYDSGASKKMPYDDRMLVRPLPVGSQANPIRGANPTHFPLAEEVGMPGSVGLYCNPGGALVYFAVFSPATNAGSEKCWPRPATSCSGRDGSQRRPTCKLNL